MKAMKYSRQRESIKEFLEGRTDHPTADMIYMNIRKPYPNISLGTVYRNLSLLVSIGEISKIAGTDGAERFDPNTKPHYHFVCRECGCVQDISLEPVKALDGLAAEGFDGSIEGHTTLFYGTCSECKKKLLDKPIAL